MIFSLPRIYPDLTDKMAMKIGGEYDISKILPRHWEKLCQESNYSYPALRKTIKYQVENLVSITETELNILKSNGFNTNVGQKILSYLDKSCTKTQKRFDI